MRASRLARRGELALTVQDPGTTDVYQVYVVEPTLISSILDLVVWGGSVSAYYTLHLLAPGGRVSQLAAFGSAYDENLWIQRAGEIVSELGVEGLRSFAKS